MASRKQIEANGKNAQLCTGPTSLAGKARSSQNALKTGIDAKSEVIRCESREEYEELIAEFYARYHPTVPEERNLVDALIRSEWLSRRFMCSEQSVWERGFNATKGTSLGQVFHFYGKTFDRLDRRINSAQRNSQKALKQLLEIRDRNLNEPVPDIPEAEIPDAAVVTGATANTDALSDTGAPPNTDGRPSRDCEGAVPEIPNPHPETEPFINPELVSFLTPASPAAQTPETMPITEEEPPIAA